MGYPLLTRLAYPLYTRGYQTDGMVGQFMGDIVRNKPKVIVDTSASDPHIPPLDLTLRLFWDPAAGV